MSGLAVSPGGPWRKPRRHLTFGSALLQKRALPASPSGQRSHPRFGATNGGTPLVLCMASDEGRIIRASTTRHGNRSAVGCCRR